MAPTKCGVMRTHAAAVVKGGKCHQCHGRRGGGMYMRTCAKPTPKTAFFFQVQRPDFIRLRQRILFIHSTSFTSESVTKNRPNFGASAFHGILHRKACSTICWHHTRHHHVLKRTPVQSWLGGTHEGSKL